MGFTIRRHAGGWSPALVCDCCVRDLDLRTAEGYVVWEVEMHRPGNGSTDPVGTITVPPSPEEIAPGFLAAVMVACSEGCREDADDHVRERSGGFEHEPVHYSLRAYLDALGEAWVTR